MKYIAKHLIGIVTFLLISNSLLSQVIFNSVTSTPVKCSGNSDGTIILSITGGVPPYVYFWFEPPLLSHADTTAVLNHTFTNLGAGTYLVGVKDNNGSGATYYPAPPTIDVGTPSPLVVNINPNPGNACSGVGLPLTASTSGGNGSNTHSWYGTGASHLDFTDRPNVIFTHNIIGGYALTDTVKDSKGCIAFKDASVTVNALPTPTLIGSNSLCAGTSGVVYTTEAAKTNYVWSVSGGGTITAGGTAASNTVTVTWNTAGAQTVSVNYTDNGCPASSPTIYNVTVKALPTPTLGGSNSVCAGTSGVVYTTEAGKTNYVWIVSAGGTITAGGTAASNTVTVTWNTAGAQTVSINYTDINGCQASTPTIYNVTVKPLPTPTLGGSNSVCAGTSGVIYTTEAGKTNYIWSISGGGTITAGGTAASNTVTVTWNTAGAQTVSINYTDVNGCQASTPTIYNVTVKALPTPTLGGSNSVCAGTSGVVYTTEAAKTNYVWSVSGGGTITAGGTAASNTVTVTWNTAGAQTVSVNYTDNGCPASSPTIYNVTVKALPTPTLGGSNSVCAGTSGVVYTTEAGKTNYVWIVSAGGTITAGGTAADNTVTVTWNTAGAQTVSINYTDVNGCQASTPTIYNVTVKPLPTPTLGGSNSVCAGTSGVIYTTEAGKTNYIWSISGGGTITAGGTAASNTVTVTWNTAGAQSVSINYTDVNGCQASTPTIYNVTVKALPTPTLGGSNSVCAGTSGVVYTTEAAKTNYVWSVSGGGTITAGGTVASNTVTVTWNTAGAQTVSVNYTDNGCPASSPTIYNVTVKALPTPTLGGSNSVCAGTSGVIYTTETGKTNYVWIVSVGGTITAGGTAADNTVTVTWNTAGAQTVSINYAETGCSAGSPTIYNVTVKPLPTPTLGGSNSVCAGTSGVVYTTEAGKTNYVWSVSAGGTITAGGTAASNTVTITWNTAGAQTISVNYTDNGCSASSPTIYNVTVKALPTPTLGGSNNVCAGTSGVVYTTEAAKTNYVWSVSGGGTITAGGTAASNTVTVTWNTAGAQTVSVNYTDNGCPASSPTIYNVTVKALPTPTIGGSNSVCAGTSGVVYTTEAGKTNYVWIISGGGTITAGGTIADNTVTLTWNTAGAQTVSVNYTETGCSASSPTIYNVTVNPLPINTYTVSDLTICFLDDAIININGSENVTSYQMKTVIGDIPVGNPVIGTGAPINITIPNASIPLGTTKYYVEATSGPGCVIQLPDLAVVTKRVPVTEIVSDTNALCFGAMGSIVVHAAGGTAPYHISIQGSAGPFNHLVGTIPTLAGNYQVVAQDFNGCKSSAFAVSISQPVPITFTLDTASANCTGTNNGHITITASGGTRPYQYSIYGDDASYYVSDSDFRPLPPDVYPVIVKDTNNCKSNTVTITLIEANQINVGYTVNEPPKEICFGDSGTINLSATGGSGNFEYSMSTTPGVPGIYQPTGSFYLRGRTNYYGFVHDITTGCIGLADNGNAISINTNPKINIFIIGIDSVSPCSDSHNGRIRLNQSNGGKGGPFDYHLDVTDFGANRIFNFLAGGTHTIRVYDKTLRCHQDSIVMVGAPPAIVIDSIVKKDLKCPNDHIGEIHITAHGGIGTLLYSINGVPYSTSHDTTGLDGGDYQIRIKDWKGCPKDTTIHIFKPLPLAISRVDTTPITCNGLTDGTINVTMTGGTLPLKFTLYPGGIIFNNTGAFNALAKGKYVVEITDKNNCDTLRTDSLEIREPNLIVIDSTQFNDVKCFGISTGKIHIFAKGGTSPLTYSLAPGGYSNQTGIFDSLPANTYNISVTDMNSCGPTLGGPVAINQPAQIVLSTLIIDSLTCHLTGDGAINAVATGGAGTLMYTLDGGAPQPSGNFSPLTGGFHNLHVTDSLNCKLDSTVNVIDPGPIKITSGVADAVSCIGFSDGTITVNASGGNQPLTYTLSPATLPANTTGIFNPLPIGKYVVKVTDPKSCPADSTDSLSVLDAQPVILDKVNTTKVNGPNKGTANIIAHGGSGPFKYWIDNGPKQDTSFFGNLVKGHYMAHVSNISGCEEDSQKFDINDTLLTRLLINIMTTAPCPGQDNGDIIFINVNHIPKIQYSYSNTTDSLSPFSDTFLCCLPADNYNLYALDSTGTIRFDTIVVLRPLQLARIDTTYSKCNVGNFDGSIQVHIRFGNKPYSFTWIPNTLPNDSVVTNLAPGDYSVSVSDSTGCLLSNIPATISALDTLLVDIIEKPATCLDQGSIRLSVSSSQPPVFHIWNGDTLGSFATKIGTIKRFLANGNYIIKVIDAYNCSVQNTYKVDTMNWLYVSAGHDTDICRNDSFAMQSEIKIGTQIIPFDSINKKKITIRWTPKENFYNDTILNAVIKKQPPDMSDVNNYTLTAVYGTNCDTSAGITLTYYPANGVKLPDTIQVSRDVHEIIPIIGGIGTYASYKWVPSLYSIGNSDVSRNLVINNFTSPVPFTYYFTGTTSYGCPESDSVVVTKADDVVPAGGFTPNGDFRNDKWYIKYAESYTTNELTVEIFDRWGQKIFMQKGYDNASNAWDGTYNGKPLPIGTYYYVITVKNGTPKQGTVTILKTRN